MNKQKTELTAAMAEMAASQSAAMAEMAASQSAAMAEMTASQSAAMAEMKVELAAAISGQNDKIEKLNNDMKWVKIVGGAISTILVLPYVANFF